MNKNRNQTITPLKLAVLGSGKGSNFQSIIDAINNKSLNAEVVCVISDVEDAFILKRAECHGINSKFISAAPFKTKLEGSAEDKYIETIIKYKADIIVLAGFMRIIKKEFLKVFSERILNIHPSLLPAFPGLESWKQALEYGVKITGCTVHFVDQGMDTGLIIIQKVVPVLENDTPESLHARIQVEEHKAYPEAIELIIKDTRARRYSK